MDILNLKHVHTCALVDMCTGTYVFEILTIHTYQISTVQYMYVFIVYFMYYKDFDIPLPF